MNHTKKNDDTGYAIKIILHISMCQINYSEVAIMFHFQLLCSSRYTALQIKSIQYEKHLCNQ